MMKDTRQQGLEAEFLEAYELYADAIFRHCLYRVFNKERAKEVTQDTFMKTWEVVARGEEIQNIRAYLYRVAHNLIVDEARRRKLRKETSLEEMREATGFDPGVDDREQMQRYLEGSDAMQRLLELSEEDREILILRHVDELEPKEIADLLGVTANVISVRSHRALKRLREVMNTKHEKR